MLGAFGGSDGGLVYVNGVVVAAGFGVLGQLAVQCPVLFQSAVEKFHLGGGGGGAHFRSRSFVME